MTETYPLTNFTFSFLPLLTTEAISVRALLRLCRTGTYAVKGSTVKTKGMSYWAFSGSENYF